MLADAVSFGELGRVDLADEFQAVSPQRLLEYLGPLDAQQARLDADVAVIADLAEGVVEDDRVAPEMAKGFGVHGVESLVSMA